MDPTINRDEERLRYDSLETVKRNILLIAMPAGVVSMLIVWGIGLKQHTLSVWDFIALPFLAVAFLCLGVLLWRRIILLRTFELVVYTLVVLYAISEFVSVLVQTIVTKGIFSSNFTLWIPLIYVLAFLILDIQRALICSLIFLFSILAVGVGLLVRFSLAGMHFQDISLLAQIYLASAFYIVVLYIMARLKDHYVSERSIVDAMSKLAMTDPLTKTDNRRLLDRLLREEIVRAERHAFPLSVLLFDLDRFKNINDAYGHNTGDVILQEVAHLLRQNIRASDPFGRWGGDEFLCLATNTDGKQATELAERLREALQRYRFTKVDSITASFGVTTYQPGDTPETLVRRADMGLYKAKASGRNRVEVVLAGITLPLFEGEKPYPSNESETD